MEGQSINLLPPVKVRPESLINQGINRLSCRHIIPCAGESGACAFYLRPVWPRSGRRQSNTPGWWWEDTASRIPGIFSGAGKYHFPSELLPEPVQPAAQTAQNTGKGRRSTIYEAYSRGSPGEGRAFPARHSWRISLLPAFGSLHARSGSAPAAGRSFLPSPLLGKFQLETLHFLSSESFFAPCSDRLYAQSEETATLWHSPVRAAGCAAVYRALALYWTKTEGGA